MADGMAQEARQGGPGWPPASVCGHMCLALNAAAMTVAALGMLQLMVMPLGVIRMAWWPSVVAAQLFAAACLWRGAPEDDRKGHILRWTALVALGLSPFWRFLPLAQRAWPQAVGWHRAICMLAALAAFVANEYTLARVLARRLGAAPVGRLYRAAETFWRLAVILPLATMAVCLLLVLRNSQDLTLAGLPDALLQALTGVGQIPVAAGWVICAACALSAASCWTALWRCACAQNAGAAVLPPANHGDESDGESD